LTSEHWLDRLASPHTRRQSLKAAVAGVALGLPLQRTATASADNPNASSPTACRRGCFYTSHRMTGKELGRCEQAITSAKVNTFVTLFFGNIPAGIANVTFLRSNDGCGDRALITKKARDWDCLQPNCPGFDPNGEFGPCEPCNAVAGCLCCPSATSFTGYDSCTNPPYCCGTAPGGFGCVPCG
jgi:hypothetical protein